MAFDRGEGGSQTGSASVTTTPVTIQQGGTGATTAAQARTNLGLKDMAQQDPASVTILGGSIANISPPIAVASGGTGASTAAGALENLLPSYAGNAGRVLAINPGGTTVQWSTTGVGNVFGATSSIDGDVVLFDGTDGKVLKSGGQLGTAAFSNSADFAQDTAVVKLTGNQTIAGVKTFSSTITGDISGNAGTVTNGLYSTGSYANPSWITSLAETKVLPSQTSNSGKYLTTNGTSTSWATVDALPLQTGNNGKYLTTDGSTASWDALATVANSGSYNDLSNLPTLGTISSQAANNVSITGGSITGITDLAVADGGTGASTAANARVNLLPSYTANGGKVLTVNTGATDVEWAVVSGGQFEGNAANKAIMWNAQNIAENITIVGTHNAGSFGPITIDSTYTVTVNSGAVWTII